MRQIPRLTTFGVAIALMIGFLGSSRPANAAGWDEVEFVGSGWGHGVGLSQYGARAMAVQGNDYRAILAHYYKGTSISTLAPATTLWVNLERNFTKKVLRVRNTATTPGTQVTITSEAGSVAAQPGASISIALVGLGCSVEVTNPSASPVMVTDPSDCSFDFSWYPWDVPGQNPTTKIEIDGCALPDWNTLGGTVWRPCQYARGTLHLRQGSGGLHLSAELLSDDYVLGISEVPYAWEMAALKAQAVAARTYAEARRLVRLSLRPDTCWCHVMDTTADQRYVGWGHSGTASWETATRSTALQVLTHPSSSLGVVTAYYSSSSGGATEHGHLKGYSSVPVEWLTSVNDKWAVDGTVWNPNASWTVKVDAGSIAGMLGIDSLSEVEVTSTRPGSGSAATVAFRGYRDGSSVIITKSGDWVRANMGLKSEYFRVSFRAPGDEMFFYRSADGAFAYYDVAPNGNLSAPIIEGSGYSTGWSSVTAVDLDGDSQDEIFFYRSSSGSFRYYSIGDDGQIGSPIQGGGGYSLGWTSITAVDLNGDGKDEMFFYRSTDGAYRYYTMRPDGTLATLLQGGGGYSLGWTSITAVDLNGDGKDEMFFYRSTDGAYRYYDIGADGKLKSKLNGDSGYSTGWSSITAIDLDGN